MKKKILKIDTIVCLLALFITFMVLVTIGTMSGKITYVSDKYTHVFTFPHVICGSNSFEYYIGPLSRTGEFTQATNVYESGTITMYDLKPTIIVIIAYVLSFLAGIGAVLISILGKDKKIQRYFKLTCVCVLGVCALIIFLSPMFAKTNMREVVHQLFGNTSDFGKYSKARVSGSFFAGIGTLIAAILIFSSLYVKEDEQIKEIECSSLSKTK